MATRFGAVAAMAMSAVARVLGVVIFYLLRWIYRPNERAIALGVLAVIIAVIAGLVYLL